MKTYFILSDIHGFYCEMEKALNEVEFDKTNKNHIIILCGDAFDRGDRNVDVCNFFLNLQKQQRLIYIRGNHEDLILSLINNLTKRETIPFNHVSNGTLDTISQFTNISMPDLIIGNYNVNKLKQLLKPLIKFINSSINYYQLKDYVFVHGWVPYVSDQVTLKASEHDWRQARWQNGMGMWKQGFTIPNKTIVCGHWNSSFGNYHYHNKGFDEWSQDSDHEIFIDKGIIALDGSVALSHKVNVFIIKEDE